MTRRKTKSEVTEEATVDDTVDIVDNTPLITETPTTEEMTSDEDAPVKTPKVKPPKVKPMNHDKLLPRSASKYVPPLRPFR